MSIKIEVKNKGSVEFGVMSLPDRKSKFLFSMRGGMVEPLAYFRNDECAEQFEKIIDFIIDSLGTDKNE